MAEDAQNGRTMGPGMHDRLRRAGRGGACESPNSRGFPGTREVSEAAGWLGNLDSNQDKQSQSLLCYRYTIPQ